MFSEIPIDNSIEIKQSCNQLITAANGSLFRAIQDFKNRWVEFWDPSISIEEMQSRLDTLASLPMAAADGSDSNCLAEYFAKARRFINYILIEIPDAFADSVSDSSGQCQRFLSPGWRYSTEANGRIVVIAPCAWMDGVT